MRFFSSSCTLQQLIAHLQHTTHTHTHTHTIENFGQLDCLRFTYLNGPPHTHARYPQNEDDFLIQYDRNLIAAFDDEANEKREARERRKAENPEWYGRRDEIGVLISVPEFGVDSEDEEDNDEGGEDEDAD